MGNNFDWTADEAPKLIKNQDLVCKDCIYRMERTDICKKYPYIKPYRVLDGGSCDYRVTFIPPK